jgi:hypothetical protein
VEQMKSKDVANSFVPKLPSFRKFVEAKSGKEKLDLLVDDAHIKVALIYLKKTKSHTNHPNRTLSLKWKKICWIISTISWLG